MRLKLILASLLALSASKAIVSAAKLETIHARSGTSNDDPGSVNDILYFGAGPNGEGHSMLGNDAIIGQAMSWGVKFYFQKFVDIKKLAKFGLDDPNAFRVPSVQEYNNNVEFPQGTSVMLSCYDQSLFDTQAKLNKECAQDPKCKKAYIAASLWGTIGKMDFKKDAIVLRACVLLVVDTSGDCGFPDSPSCKTKVYQDLTKQTDAGSVKDGDIVEFGPAGSIKQVTSVLQDWAKKNKQQITLPDGNTTK
ncbi:uncharacterized protein FA14DRAFT_183209 [Meira miltonrushii]|uniref:Uncharacterized protein n=1 Tax=Meira miltonrushii TaxID=1280837 RepID=A0A316VKH4_9BASI|nr:uncharacterized protein FA14DRAFT_183209 [Meira miltonrushii]PWN36833.1 hypothetical protein FA14DRAFT_183209 [Meira miltonrushii]